MKGYKQGEQKTLSILVEPLVCVLKSGIVGYRRVHGSIRDVADRSLSMPDVAFSDVSLKSPPRIIECPSACRDRMKVIKSVMKACRG